MLRIKFYSRESSIASPGCSRTWRNYIIKKDLDFLDWGCDHWKDVEIELIWLNFSRWSRAFQPWSHFFTRSDTNITRGHNWKLKKTHNQSDIRLHLFSHRSINRWNSLPHKAVDAPSINSFKNHLEKLRIHQMDLFMDWRPPKSYGCTNKDWYLLIILHQPGAAAPGMYVTYFSKYVNKAFLPKFAYESFRRWSWYFFYNWKIVIWC